MYPLFDVSNVVIMSKVMAMSTLGAEHVWKSLSLLFIMLLTGLKMPSAGLRSGEYGSK